MIVIKAISRITADSIDPVVEATTEVRARTLQREGVLGYDFFLQDDDHIVALEAYEDSDVLVAHIEAGGFDRLFEVVEVERIELMGPISPEVRERFEALGNVVIYPSLTADRMGGR